MEKRLLASLFCVMAVPALYAENPIEPTTQSPQVNITVKNNTNTPAMVFPYMYVDFASSGTFHRVCHVIGNKLKQIIQPHSSAQISIDEKGNGCYLSNQSYANFIEVRAYLMGHNSPEVPKGCYAPMNSASGYSSCSLGAQGQMAFDMDRYYNGKTFDPVTMTVTLTQAPPSGTSTPFKASGSVGPT